MTALTHVATPADELLWAAARDIEKFLAEVRRLNTDDDAWRDLIAVKCSALSEQLSNLHTRLENQVQGARAAIEDLRLTLTEYPEEITNGAGIPSLRDFQDSMGQRYDAFMETLRAQRLTIRADQAMDAASESLANRQPKLKRAFFHVLMGVSCVGLYQFVVNKGTALVLLSAFVVFFGAVEILRRFSTRINDFWTDRVFRGIGRPQERYQTNSASYYLWGMTLIALVAPKTIVCAALLILSFGDPAASAFGHRVNLVRFKNGKSLGGMLAFVLVSGLVAGLYLGLYGGMSTAGWIGLTAVMAMAGAVAELSNGKVDDNFAIPVACAGAGMVFSLLAFT